MQYRRYGNTAVTVSALGFGCMRLPMRDNHVVRDEAVRLIRRGIDLGINYLDTGSRYCSGESEAVLGEAVKGCDRARLYIATKYAPEPGAPTAEDLRRKFERSLRLMDQEYVDFYHLWGISWKEFKEKLAVKGGPLEAFLKLREEGLAKHLSFSFHSKPEEMKRLVDTGYFETVLCQYNLLDRSNEESIAYAAGKGLGVATMGSVGGGRLGGPSEVLSGLLEGRGRVSTPELALRFVLSNPGVSVALSGMNAAEQVEENVATASRDSFLTPEEREKIGLALEENRRLAELYCTGCKYCMPCLGEVNIPRIFELYNYERIYGLKETARSGYGRLAGRKRDASACTECGECEEKCPQKLSVREKLKEAHEALSRGFGTCRNRGEN